MTQEEVQAILDQARFGDTLTVVRTSRGRLTATVSGPVVATPTLSPAVGIDMLDGAPYLVRWHDGSIWGEFLRVDLEKGARP